MIRRNPRPQLSTVMIVFALLALPMAAGAIYEVPIYEPGLEKFSIGIPDFKNVGSNPDEAFAQKARDLLVDDLLLSGYFDIIDKALYIEEPGAGLTVGEFDFDDWVILRAHALVKVGFVIEPDSLTMEMRYFDVTFRQQELGKRYTGKPEDYDSMIHRFANEIIKLLTGEPGIFGTHVAFVSNRTGNKEIYTIGINGDKLRAITKNGSMNLGPDWSPDGAWLTVTTYVQGQPRLFKIPVAGGKGQVISARDGLNFSARWSPSGREIAMTLSKDGNSELYLIRPDGEIKKRLTVSWSIEVSPSWSPDGDRLAFVSDRTGTPQVYVMDISSGEVRRITFTGSYNVSPAWSPKGDWIIFQGLEGGTYQVYMVDPTGETVRRLSDGIGSNEDAVWSPDGRAIVYVSSRSGNKNLYITNIDGSYTKQLTSGNWSDSSPAWSPRLLE